MIEAPHTTIQPNQLEAFAEALPKAQNFTLSLLQHPEFRQNSFSLAKKMFPELVDLIDQYVKKPEVGIFYIDIANSADTVVDQRGVFIRCLLAIAIANAVSPTLADSRSGLPFTLYQSSAGQEQSLRARGVRFYSPNEKLGFHNDGVIHGASIVVPKYVSLLNLFIGYESPGNFYWIPFTKWTSLQKFLALYEKRSYKLEVTPIVYKSDLDNDGSAESRFVAAPMFYRSGNGVPHLFVNGRMVSEDGSTNDFDTVRSSLLENAFRFYVPQQLYRLVVLSNSTGVHSRDIFEDQLVTNGITRSFIRIMSDDCDHV